MKDGEMPLGRAIPISRRKKTERQVWMHGLALLPQKQRAEAHSKHGKPCRDRPWHQSITKGRTYPCRQQISTSGCALEVTAVCSSLSCCAKPEKRNATGHRVWLFFRAKQHQAVAKTPNWHLQKNPFSIACSEVLQLRKGGEERKPHLCSSN